MNEITCGLCMDLIPLVRDGIASGESRDAVERHVQSCAACRKLYSGAPPPLIRRRRSGSSGSRRVCSISCSWRSGYFLGWV